MRHGSFPLAVVVTLFFVGGATSVQAQMSNKPFSFSGTPHGGVGMSVAGQQAILNKEILGSTPKNLVRGVSGELLSVSRGPGHSAIVSREGEAGFLPKFRGTSFRGNNSDISVGVFNTFFSSNRGGASGSAGSLPISLYSTSVVNTWTARIVTGGAPISYLPNNAVDNWTGLVHTPY